MRTRAKIEKKGARKSGPPTLWWGSPVMSERRDPAIRVTAMPADANAYGDIFGGWLVSLMDSVPG